jgi:hypoxanthine phosphoribosyltransferase
MTDSPIFPENTYICNLNILHELVQILDKRFDLFISEEEILREVHSLGSEISKEYLGKEIVFIALLNGSFMFASDLLKQISIPCQISFVKVSSYHGTESSGKVKELIGLNEEIENKHVILLEDIVDTGNTIDSIFPTIIDKQPASVKICTLLYKPEAFTGKYRPDLIGFTIPNAFVVGYGLDYDGYGRNLKAIYQLKKED